ncbi:MAG: hypothetical protein MUF75_02330 [Bacteroidia bacterium]|jgi:hypothetical protein|nr:hypothetical protein [Bacteroidia bacterium]
MAETEKKDDLFVRVKATRSPKPKTDTEGSDQVESIAVEVNQSETAEGRVIELNIHIQDRSVKPQNTH